jgi:thioredoxin-dependent peroxiredoxin
VIEPGRQAPDFNLPDRDGREVTLSDVRGRRVVLYPYPRADTPGCTTQACGVRDHAADYACADALVLGALAA